MLGGGLDARHLILRWSRPALAGGCGILGTGVSCEFGYAKLRRKWALVVRESGVGSNCYEPCQSIDCRRRRE